MTYSGFTNPVYEEWKKSQQNLFSSFHSTPSPSKESRETFYYVTSELPPLKERTEEEIAKQAAAERLESEVEADMKKITTKIVSS